MKKIISGLLSIVIAFSCCTATTFAYAENEVATTSSVSDLIGKIVDTFTFVIKNVFRYESHKSYEDVIDKAYFAIPGLDDEFIPQGMCYVEALGMFAISGYMPDDSEGNERDSRIYLVNPDTNTAKMFEIKDYTGHAGGIASSGDNIWISSGGGESSNGKIYHFSTDLFAGEGNTTVKYDGYIQVPSKGSGLFCDDNKLWVFEYYNFDYAVKEEHTYGTNHAWACGYDLPLDVDYSEKKEVAPQVILSLPKEVQGMSVTPNGEVVFSTSFSPFLLSQLKVYENYENWDSDTVNVFGADVPLYVAKGKNIIKKIVMPTMAEGIDYNNGKLYVLFESGAKKYSMAFGKNKNVWEVDIDTIISK